MENGATDEDPECGASEKHENAGDSLRLSGADSGGVGQLLGIEAVVDLVKDVFVSIPSSWRPLLTRDGVMVFDMIYTKALRQ